MEDPTTKVETIPVTEVENWLKENIKPYLQRIEKLEESEKRKDSQIHCLTLALEQLKTLVANVKDTHAHGSQTKIGVNGRPSTSSTTFSLKFIFIFKKMKALPNILAYFVEST